MNQLKWLLFIATVIIVCTDNTFIKADESATEIDCPEIVTKKRWGGHQATNIEYQIIPVKYVIVHHTVTNTCNIKSDCSRIVQNIQNYHMNELGYWDIGFNFLIGNDGRVYEGTGWHKVAAHTYGYNRLGLGIAFIGNFSDELPTEAALAAAENLLKCGVKDGELDANYILLGGRQVIASESPGLELYVKIQDWDHWVSKP